MQAACPEFGTSTTFLRSFNQSKFETNNDASWEEEDEEEEGEEGEKEKEEALLTSEEPSRRHR